MTSPKSDSKFAFLPRVSGGFAVAIGVMVLLGLYAHWTTVVQLLPSLPPMKYNTALAFILSGIATILLTTKYAKIAPWLGALVGLLGVATLVEYVNGIDLGIDEFFLKAYIATATEFPGRMSPLAASCFIFIGATLVLTGLHQRPKAQLTAIGFLTCIVGTISFVALFGYLFGIDSANGWGAYTRMAVHTAATFLALSMGLLFWAWQIAERTKFNFLRWLPVTASVTLMMMVALISTVSFTQFKSATDWRKHTYDVLSTAQIFQGDVFDTQRGMRRYVLTGQASALETYQEGMKNADRHLAELVELTSDNPVQNQNAKQVAHDFDVVRDYAHRLLNLRDKQGIQAAIQLESTDQGSSRSTLSSRACSFLTMKNIAYSRCVS